MTRGKSDAEHREPPIGATGDVEERSSRPHAVEPFGEADERFIEYLVDWALQEWLATHR